MVNCFFCLKKASNFKHCNFVLQDQREYESAQSIFLKQMPKCERRE